MISNITSDILVALVVLGVIIVIHELGHFLVAKFFKIKVETFSVGAAGLSVQRLDSILQSRGIHGIMLLPSWDDPDLSNLDWSRYAGIYTDYIIERPALHSVCSDHYRSLLAGLQRLASLGHARLILRL